MKAKEYLAKKAEAEKAAAEAQPPAFILTDVPSFVCQVGATGDLVLHGSCPAKAALDLAAWITETYSE